MSLADQSLQFFPVSARVSVLRARGLRIKGKDGTNDTYAVLQAGRETFRTPVAEKRVEPVWDDAVFIFTLPAESARPDQDGAPVQVRVLHRVPLGADKLLGLTVINVHELRQNSARENPQWFKLVNKAGKTDKERGEVLLDIQFLKSSMSVSMIDLSDKSHSRLGKFKDKLRGKKKEGLSDSASAILPSASQVLTDSEGEMDGETEGEATKKKKNKLKSLFVPKSNMKRNSMSQSMSSLGTLPDKNSSISSSTSSGLNVESSEGKKKKKFTFLKHKRNGSTDSKASNHSKITLGSTNQNPPSQIDICINDSHVYGEEDQSEEMQEMEEEEEEGEKEEEEESWRREEEERERLEEERSREAEEERKRKEKEEQRRKAEEEKERIRREREKEEQRRIEEEEKERMRIEREKEEQRRRMAEEKERIRMEREKEEEKERIRMEREIEEQRRRMEEEEKERLRIAREKEEQKRRMDEEGRIWLEREKEEQRRRMEEEEKERIRMEREIEERRRRREEEEKERKRIEREKEEQKRRMDEEEKERISLEREKEEQRRRMEEEEKERQRIKKEEQRRKSEEEERMRIKKEKEEEIRKLEEERKRKEEREAKELRRKTEEENDRKKAEEEKKIRIAEGERLKEEKRRAERERIMEEEEKQKEEKRIEMERGLADEKEKERRIAEEKEKRRKEEERFREEKERKRVEMEMKRKEEERERRNVEMEEKKKREEQMREEQERLRKEEKLFEESIIPQSTDFTRSARISNVKPSMPNTNPFLDDSLDASISENVISVEKTTAKKGHAPLPPQLMGSDVSSSGAPKQHSHLKEVSKRPAPRPPGVTKVTREVTAKEYKDDQEGLFQGAKKTPESYHESKVLPVSEHDTHVDTNPFACDGPVTIKRNKRPAPKPGIEIPVSEDKLGNGGKIVTEGTVRLKEKAGASDGEDNPPNLNLSRAPNDITVKDVKSDPADDLSGREEELEDIVEPHSVKSNAPSCVNQNLGQEPLVCKMDGLTSTERSQRKSRAPLPPTKPKRTGDPSIPLQQPSLINKTKLQQTQENHSDKDQDSASDSSVEMIAVSTPSSTVSSSLFRPLAEKSQDKRLCATELVQTGSGSGPRTKVEPNDAGDLREQVAPTSVIRQHAVKPLSAAENQPENHESRVTDNAQPKTKAAEATTKGPYSQLTQTELISLALRQQEQISQRDARIHELELYIDTLLVRVMEEKPSILMTLNTKNKSI